MIARAATRIKLDPQDRLHFGNPAKARKQLGWELKVRFKELVKKLVDADLKLAEHETRVKPL